MGNLLTDGLDQLTTDFPNCITEVEAGLMVGLQLKFDPTELIAQLRCNGLLSVGAGGQTLRLLPPLTVTEKEIEQCLIILQACLSKIDS